MPTANPSLQHLMDGDFEGAQAIPTPQLLGLRLLRRRKVLQLIAGTYAIDVVLLLLYAQAGTVPLSIGLGYAACGVVFIAVFATLSETGFNDRFRDHHFVVPHATVATLQLLAFNCLAPQIGAQFICTQFIVISFSALRSTPLQCVLMWLLGATGLAALFLLAELPLSIPLGSPFERAVTVLMLVMTTGRCMFLGIFANSQRASLYKRGLELSAVNRKIEELAELDELTGSYNRRCIMRMLDDEIARSQRTHTSCCIALIDLDWFKRINDTYGHPTGDEVLRTFAITVFANIRSIDKFGRYGGEEFLLVLPETSEDTATQMLDRLRSLVTMLDWSAFSEGLTVTISAGVAKLVPTDTSDTLLARADKALYVAKKRGRNRIARA
jgi:diguanylate cyclase